MTYADLIRQIGDVHPIPRAAVETLAIEWSSDEPTRTVLLGHIGTAVVRRKADLGDAALRRLFEIVEHALSQGDQDLKDAVATGFLEALVADAPRMGEDFAAIGSLLGPESTAYCKAWDAFTGVRTPGLKG